MSTRGLSNKEYLKLYLAGNNDYVGKVLLPHESKAVEKAVEKQRNAYNEVIKQKNPCLAAMTGMMVPLLRPTTKQRS